MVFISRLTREEKKKIESIYKEAFPSNERVPFGILKMMHLLRMGELLGITDAGRLVGFCFLKSNSSLTYIVYLAIDKNIRNEGYGGRALLLIRERYPGRKLMLAIEAPDKNAANQKQRLQRRSFYERNGFYELPDRLKEGGVNYSLMATNRNSSKEELWKLIAG